MKLCQATDVELAQVACDVNDMFLQEVVETGHVLLFAKEDVVGKILDHFSDHQ